MRGGCCGPPRRRSQSSDELDGFDDDSDEAPSDAVEAASLFESSFVLVSELPPPLRFRP